MPGGAGVEVEHTVPQIRRGSMGMPVHDHGDVGCGRIDIEVLELVHDVEERRITVLEQGHDLVMRELRAQLTVTWEIEN